MKKTKQVKFAPKLSFYELEYYLKKSDRLEVEIKNTVIYDLVKQLTYKLIPTTQDKYDKRWLHLYLPVRREGRVISIPFSIVEYRKEFFIGFHLLGNLHIKKGKTKIEPIYKDIIKEALRLLSLIKLDKNIIKKTVPYDYRTGKIKGKHILKKLLTSKQKEKILSAYDAHLKKGLIVAEISLSDYLNAASICYQAAYPKKVRKLSPLEMYKRIADGRDGGMLSIDTDSKKAFSEWYKGSRWIGSHPFEIVFSWHDHGIHLYPPSESSQYYVLSVTNYAYANDFIQMAMALVKKQIPFQARELKEVLVYLTGETYFAVNEYEDHRFTYIPSKEYKRLYFPYIEWDKLKMPEFR